jgi:hypothetical protein
MLDAIHPGLPGWAQVEQVHNHPVRRNVLDTATSVLIVLRDPIDRLVSAYNTEAENCEEATTTNCTEAVDELRRCFPNVAAFANGIDGDNKCGRLARGSIMNAETGQIGMGTCFYIGGLLDTLRGKRVHLIHTETCDADVAAVPEWLGLDEWLSFGARTQSKHTVTFPHKDDNVGAEGRRRLQRHLAPEYAMLAELRALASGRTESDPLAPDRSPGKQKAISSITVDGGWGQHNVRAYLPNRTSNIVFRKRLTR